MQPYSHLRVHNTSIYIRTEKQIRLFGSLVLLISRAWKGREREDPHTHTHTHTIRFHGMLRTDSTNATLHILYIGLTKHFASPFISRAWAGIVKSTQKLATGWTIRGSNPGGGEIFRNRPDRTWGPPAYGTRGTGSVSRGLKGRCVELTTHPN